MLFPLGHAMLPTDHCQDHAFRIRHEGIVLDRLENDLLLFWLTVLSCQSDLVKDMNSGIGNSVLQLNVSEHLKNYFRFKVVSKKYQKPQNHFCFND